jgi:hypothetical protein
MARKATPAATPAETAPFPVAAITETQNTMAAHAAEVIEAFGDGLPWSPQHYETAIRNELRRGCDAFLRAGRYLTVARECSAHGEWLDMLGRLGMEPRQAQRMMEAARRIVALPNASTSTHLIAATGTQSKLIELLSLPEDQFAELATAGETGGLGIDDVAEMTVQELRAAVREARAEADAARAHTAERDTKISRLQDDVAKAKRKWKAATPDEQSATLREQVDQAKQIVLNALAPESDDAGLMGALLALAAHADEHRIDVRTYMGGVIAELIDTLDRIRANDYIQAPVLALAQED